MIHGFLLYLIKVLIMIGIFLNIMPRYMIDHLGWTSNLHELVGNCTRYIMIVSIVPFVIIIGVKFICEIAECRWHVTMVMIAVVVIMSILPDSTIV